MRATCAVVLLFSLGPVPDLHAQEKPILQPGAEVRVYWSGIPHTSWSKPNLQGRVTALRSDTLVVQTPRATEYLFLLSSLDRLEVKSRRNKSGALQGAGRGLLIGVVFGTGLTVATGLASSDGYCAVSAAMVGGAVTVATVLGGLIAGATSSDVWEEVQLDRWRIAPVATVDGRFGLAALVWF